MKTLSFISRPTFLNLCCSCNQLFNTLVLSFYMMFKCILKSDHKHLILGSTRTIGDIKDIAFESLGNTFEKQISGSALCLISFLSLRY